MAEAVSNIPMKPIGKTEAPTAKKAEVVKEAGPVKETLGTSKKKRRLRDGRRSLMSGSAMGVSDKLG